MAVNALVIRNGIPVPEKREQFLHMDEGLSIEIGNNNVYRGKGKVYLTNFRLIFLKRDPSREFSSFSLPYLYIIKHKYTKKLLGGAVISGTVKSIINGGLPNNTKWQIIFNDTNTGKTFYNLFEKELNKLKKESNQNLDRYKRVCKTPTLTTQEIFPDQYAHYQRQHKLQQQQKQKNIILTNHKNINNKQIIVGQSPEDAPMQLTHDYRAQKAKLFSSKTNKTNSASGPITGASPVNIHAFSQHKVGKTVIKDETNKFNDVNNIVPNGHANIRKKNDYAAPAAPQYNAYIDPSHPDDIVLSVPMNDDGFNNEDEGKCNDNYMYDIGQKYDEKHNGNGNGNAKSIVAVSVGNQDDDDDDGFNERPKVQPASIGGNRVKVVNRNNNNNKPKQQALDLNELFSQNSSSVMSNESPSPMYKNGAHKKVVDNPWDDTESSDALLNGNNRNVPSEWQQFQD